MSLRCRRLAPVFALTLAAACGGPDPVSPTPLAPEVVTSLLFGLVEVAPDGSRAWAPTDGAQYAVSPSLLPFTDPMPLETRGLTSPGYRIVPLATQPSYVSSDTTVMRVEGGHLRIVGYGNAALMAFMPTTAPAGAGIESSILISVTR